VLKLKWKIFIFTLWASGGYGACNYANLHKHNLLTKHATETNAVDCRPVPPTIPQSSRPIPLAEIVDLVFWGLLLAHTFTAVFFILSCFAGLFFCALTEKFLLRRRLAVCSCSCYFSAGVELILHAFLCFFSLFGMATLSLFWFFRVGGKWVGLHSLAPRLLFCFSPCCLRTFWKLRQVHFFRFYFAKAPFSECIFLPCFPRPFLVSPPSATHFFQCFFAFIHSNQGRQKGWEREGQQTSGIHQLCFIFHVLVLKTTTNWGWVGVRVVVFAWGKCSKKIDKAINAKRVAGLTNFHLPSNRMGTRIRESAAEQPCAQK